MLCNSRTEVDKQDRYRCTPLHLAAKNGHLEVVQMLCSSRATVDRISVDRHWQNEYTPLHMAAADGHPAVTQQVKLEEGGSSGMQSQRVSTSTTSGRAALSASRRSRSPRLGHWLTLMDPAGASSTATSSSSVAQSRWRHEEKSCLLYTSPSPRDATLSRMPSSA